ncbi:hypothetical protein [Methyloversatilis sp.]
MKRMVLLAPAGGLVSGAAQAALFGVGLAGLILARRCRHRGIRF